MDVLMNYFMQIADAFHTWMTPQRALYVMLGMTSVILAMIYTMLRCRSYAMRHRAEANLYGNLMNSLSTDYSMDENITKILRYVSSFIICEGYAMYLQDPVTGQYFVKTKLNLTKGNPQVGPSYAGLFAHKAEHFEFPGTYDKSFLKEKIEHVTEGDVPLIFLPTGNPRAFILFGPVDKISSKVRRNLEALEHKMEPVINAIIVIDEYKESSNLTLQSDKVFRNLSKVVTHEHGILGVLMDLTVKALKADGGILAVKNGGLWQIQVEKMSDQITEKLESDYSIVNRLYEAGKQTRMVTLNEEQKAAIFGEDEHEFTHHNLIGLSFTEAHYIGLFLFAIENGFTFKEKEIKFIELMVGRVRDVIGNEVKFKKMSEGYIDILMTLSDTVDSMKPSSVGYSEMVYRFSMILADEMGMSEMEKTDLAIASYLSNIGIIGISEDLFAKKGRYDPAEFERMKLHADAGSKMIEATMGNLNAAAIVRHHHERMDGLGYPSGLKGHDIPLGSRIIAVIQTFIAKIIAREYRDPLPFYDAIYSLRQLAGTQLDYDVVEAMISWFEKKRQQNTELKGSLGPCWEMRCAPKEICENCKAYLQYEKDCWTQEENNCLQHGNKCKTCFVRTEYFDRIGMTI